MSWQRPPNPRLQRTPLRAPLSRKPLGDLSRSLWLVGLGLIVSSCATRPTNPEQMYFGPWGTPSPIPEREKGALSAALVAAAAVNPEALVLARYTGDVGVGCGSAARQERRDLALLTSQTGMAVDLDNRLASLGAATPASRSRAFAKAFPEKTTILEVSSPQFTEDGAIVTVCFWDAQTWSCMLSGKSENLELTLLHNGWVVNRISEQTDMLMGPTDCP